MKSLEAVLLILAGMVGIRWLAEKRRAPGAVLPGYVVFGLLLGTCMTAETQDFLKHAGQFGFILLMYLLGLEVRIPRIGESMTALRLGLAWFFWQIPVLLLLATTMGLPFGASLVASLAISGVAVGMAHPLLHEYEERGGPEAGKLLSWLVALEVIAILTLAGGEAFLRYGPTTGAWLKLALMIATIALLAQGAPIVGGAIRRVLDRFIRWRIHGVLLLLLAVCAVSDRVGLSAPKAAFFLGLFTHTLADEDGQDAIDRALGPFAHDFLIPFFFVYLGSLVRAEALFSPALPWAALTVFTLVCWRLVVFRRRFAPACGWSESAFRTTLPNLSMVAVGVQALRAGGAPAAVSDWLLLCGLAFSVTPVFWPGGNDGASVSR